MKEQTNGAGTNAEESNVWTIGAGMLVAGLIIGFAIGWYWQKTSPQLAIDDAQSTASASLDLATSTLPTLATKYQTIDAPAFVSVDDQRAGSLVFIKHTEASKPTWIAVREIVDGSIGNILGAEMVTGATDDVPVTLLRSTVAGQKYAVYLYQDDGDGQFDFKKDLLITQSGSPVAAEFTAQ